MHENDFKKNNLVIDKKKPTNIIYYFTLGPNLIKP